MGAVWSRTRFFPRLRVLRSRRKAAPTVGYRRTVAFGQQGAHLFDLDDLLGGAAEEAQQCFAERLAEDAQTGKGGKAGGEVGVAAPRE